MKYAEKSLAIRFKAFGSEHPSVVNIYRTLNAYYWNFDIKKKSLEYFKN